MRCTNFALYINDKEKIIQKKNTSFKLESDTKIDIQECSII